MKVYVLGQGEYSNWGVIGVFATKESAQRHVDDETAKQKFTKRSQKTYYNEERYRATYDIEEFDVQGVPDAWLKLPAGDAA